MTSSTTPSSPPEAHAPRIPPVGDIRHVHLVAVAGTAMGTLACMLAARGLRVTGSDVAAYPPMSDQLATAGIEVLPGFAPEHALSDPADLVVIGNACRRDNPEARAAIDAGLPYTSQADAVRALFIDDRHSVVIAGTHGKTTTTSIVGWLLAHAGRDPSLLVGGVAENFGRSYRLGDGPHFVIEGDEYDTAFFDKTPKLLHYAARTALFTSCELDHIDIYSSMDQIDKAFVDMIAGLPAEGTLVAAAHLPGVRRVVERAGRTLTTYGVSASSPPVRPTLSGVEIDRAWHATDLEPGPDGTSFLAWRDGEVAGKLRVPLYGRHNVENVLGAVAVCVSLGLSQDELEAGLREFAGVKRRQTVRGDVAGVVVVEDFAHHPTAVAETIAAMRARYPDRTLWAVFEPRTNTSRRRVFEDAYIDALSGADRVLLADVYRGAAIPEDDRMRPERVVAALRSRGVQAEQCAGVPEIIAAVVAGRTGRDVALTMSNGDFDGLCGRLLDGLSRAEGT
jgi:UDP-N-acetylmuramate: L-alanyl-gamma-D-glutamyl-meso-diaminopimelate ligase